ncbi:hypothetical protein WOLCODRAFT_141746 [Wolfiporia cocos MD-104 SS10]|uniref:Uncharacterized protein n=1 Tax=Wolfiporia cocos (strain MD-104) TaxID=742152 RepID=A0A2H3JAI4_WOLCO|nr:hypothetical protein WOLCODRAFT_141746 [Wolfiporia cocos MD-104 SS10]
MMGHTPVHELDTPSSELSASEAVPGVSDGPLTAVAAIDNSINEHLMELEPSSSESEDIGRDDDFEGWRPRGRADKPTGFKSIPARDKSTDSNASSKKIGQAKADTGASAKPPKTMAPTVMQPLSKATSSSAQAGKGK